ncbi:hypothetical protein [Amycolatopsis sp. cmx-4-61]|uniref:hypothetical protein n=1 Tax=Amycolatopsis sp. cmx-4-61 TaxID=2790937 RepID=UPI0039786966
MSSPAGENDKKIFEMKGGESAPTIKKRSQRRPGGKELTNVVIEPASEIRIEDVRSKARNPAFSKTRAAENRGHHVVENRGLDVESLDFFEVDIKEYKLEKLKPLAEDAVRTLNADENITFDYQEVARNAIANAQDRWKLDSTETRIALCLLYMDMVLYSKELRRESWNADVNLAKHADIEPRVGQREPETNAKYRIVGGVLIALQGFFLSYGQFVAAIGWATNAERLDDLYNVYYGGGSANGTSFTDIAPQPTDDGTIARTQGLAGQNYLAAAAQLVAVVGGLAMAIEGTVRYCQRVPALERKQGEYIQAQAPTMAKVKVLDDQLIELAKIVQERRSEYGSTIDPAKVKELEGRIALLEAKHEVLSEWLKQFQAEGVKLGRALKKDLKAAAGGLLEQSDDDDVTSV